MAAASDAVALAATPSGVDAAADQAAVEALRSTGSPAAEAAPGRMARAKQLFLKWHLPGLLVLLVVLGFLVPAPGTWLAENSPLSTVCVVGIFAITGIKLQLQEVRAAIRAYPLLLIGAVLILGVTPLLGFALRLLPIAEGLRNGFVLFAAMPTTISSGIIMSADAGGNRAVALILSVGTNSLGSITVPFFLSALLQSDGTESQRVDAVQLLWKIVVTILCPLVVGMALRWFSAVRAFAKAYKTDLKVLSNVLLVLIPWLKVSQSAPLLRSVSGGDMGVVVAVAIGMHVVFIALSLANALAVRCFDIASRVSLVVMASQKTLALAVGFIAFLPTALSPGVMLISCIFGHFTQIVIDAVLVSLWPSWRSKLCPRGEPDEADDGSAPPPTEMEPGAGTGAGVGAEKEEPRQGGGRASTPGEGIELVSHASPAPDLEGGDSASAAQGGPEAV